MVFYIFFQTSLMSDLGQFSYLLCIPFVVIGCLVEIFKEKMTSQKVSLKRKRSLLLGFSDKNVSLIIST